MPDLALAEVVNIILAVLGSAFGAAVAAWKAINKTVNGKIDNLDAKNEEHFREAKEERKHLRMSVDEIRGRLRETGERVAVLWHEYREG